MTHSQEILDDHQQLDGLLRDLRVVSNWEPGHFQNPSVLAQLGKDLHSLYVRLEAHFAIEEKGHYLTEVMRRRPQARPALETLHAEHPELLGRVRSLQAFLESSGPASRNPRTLKRELLFVLDRLKDHERKETRLLQEVFGGG
ncbi:MAG: hemerythrin domain-containing protein [Bdellovibrionota bacterium]